MQVGTNFLMDDGYETWSKATPTRAGWGARSILYIYPSLRPSALTSIHHVRTSCGSIVRPSRAEPSQGFSNTNRGNNVVRTSIKEEHQASNIKAKLATPATPTTPRQPAGQPAGQPGTVKRNSLDRTNIEHQASSIMAKHHSRSSNRSSGRSGGPRGGRSKLGNA